MSRWVCPGCDREFGKAHQSHVCVPGCTVDECFAGRLWQRVIYAAIEAHLRSLGELHVDAVRVGVFLKHERKLAEVRPKVKWLSLDLFLPRELDHPRIARRLKVSADRTMHTIKLVSAEDVDAEVQAWLTEAYLAAG